MLNSNKKKTENKDKTSLWNVNTEKEYHEEKEAVAENDNK